MGLNLKGKSWAGNIYHQFESLCHDVDGFMSQGTVKSVENQMQNVGNNVKRFYSNVVQEILPRFEDNKSTESQSVGHVNSVTGIRRNPNCNNEKQHSANQVSVTMNNSDASLPIQESETCEYLGENSESVKIWNEAFNGSSDEFDENWTVTSSSSSSPAFSSSEEGNLAVEKEKEDGLSDEAASVSNISSRRLLCVSKLTMAEDTNSDGDISLHEPPVLVASVHKVNNGEDGTLSDHSFSTDNGDEEYFSEYDDEEEEEEVAYHRKIEDMLPASLLLELNNFFPIPDVQDSSVLGSSETRHEESYKDGQSETATIPSETGNSREFGVGIDEHNMETVHLSPKMKPDDVTSVGLNINLVPHRRKDFTYYKKLIQNTFTSQKRLSKEYKHLALLHGDIDLESSHNFEANSIPSSPNTSVHALETLTSHETSESDWELL